MVDPRPAPGTPPLVGREREQGAPHDARAARPRPGPARLSSPLSPPRHNLPAALSSPCV